MQNQNGHRQSIPQLPGHFPVQVSPGINQGEAFESVQVIQADRDEDVLKAINSRVPNLVSDEQAAQAIIRAQKVKTAFVQHEEPLAVAPNWFAPALNAALNEALNEALDVALLPIKIQLAMNHNMAVGDGVSCNYYPVPFPNGLLPDTVNPPLPPVLSVNDVNALDVVALNRYLALYGINNPPHLISQRKNLLLQKIGAAQGVQLQ